MTLDRVDSSRLDTSVGPFMYLFSSSFINNEISSLQR